MTAPGPHPEASRPRHSAADVATALGLPTPTPEQQAVIEAPLTSMLVVAGAGSGKTETMSGRVVWLVANGLVAPERILGLTFTRKAAGELAERIGGRLRRLATTGLWQAGTSTDTQLAVGETIEPDSLPTVATYHSYAGGIVREHGLRLGIEPDARLLTEAAAWQYAHEVVVRYDGPMESVDNAESTVTAAVRDLAGQLAEHLCTVDDLRGYLGDLERHVAHLPQGSSRAKGVPAPVKSMLEHVRAQGQILPLLEAYARTKAVSESLDFADQMALAATLAELDPGVARAERDRYSVILLDEFQDTSEAQMRLLHALFADPGAGTTRPVMAVGDPHQSIYGWRGASATTLAAFPRRFTVPASSVSAGDTSIVSDTAEGTQSLDDAGVLVPAVLPLSTSWRNDVAILAAANTTAAPLSAASPVPVRELRPSPLAGEGTLEAARLPTAAEEAAHVADWIAEHWWRPGSGRRHSGITAAVLCRRRAQFAAIADALGARGIPVEVVGLGGLLTRAEVSDLVSLLRVVHDPSRGDALMRLLIGPYVRLGAADLDALGAWSRQMRRHGGHDAAPASSDHARQEDPAERSEVDLDDEGPSLVEAVDTLPPPDWVGGQGQTLSPAARSRLHRLARTIATVRAAVGHPLPELVVLAERSLGLDVEVAAALDTLPETARRHLDAFADAAAGFAHGADRPTLGGFLDWLDAARDEERGLDSPASHVAEGAVQVLTVHAAKGLEWDVVAVPGLVEAAFPSHRSYAAPKAGGLPTPSSKGWLTGLGSIPYDLRGDRDGLPRLPWQGVDDLTELAKAIGEFSAEGGRHALEEERRLAYVAFTRARHRLLLSASVWLDGEKPRVTSRFLTELLEVPGLVRSRVWAAEPEPDATNPALLETPAARWPVVRDDPRDAAERVSAAWVEEAARDRRRRLEDPRTEAPDGTPSRDLLAELADELGIDLETDLDGRDAEELAELSHLVEILIAERSAPRVDENVARLPGHLSTSALVDLRTDRQGYAERLRRPMPAPPATAARLGTAFHSWIEQHYRSASLVDDLDLEGYADEPEEIPDLEKARELFLASPWASATPLAVEVSLETVVAGLPVRGRIDAVFPRADGGVTIVDWKTGSPPSPQRLAERSVQLAVYRLAYSRWSGLPLEQIDAAFYYAATGATLRPDLPGEDELVALLADLTAAPRSTDVSDARSGAARDQRSERAGPRSGSPSSSNSSNSTTRP
ncbi:ATP-dependent helicase [Mobilicoccus massiliensis]|uniref:ATP-dependent helicase n=1 Tax=Mobilicoccus massiliensis TaxID=1522310 RepID=UPI0009E63AA4|nr:ATP-dependent DNA helicase [Mobilicoccus massiliensis]